MRLFIRTPVYWKQAKLHEWDACLVHVMCVNMIDYRLWRADWACTIHNLSRLSEYFNCYTDWWRCAWVLELEGNQRSESKWRTDDGKEMVGRGVEQRGTQGKWATLCTNERSCPLFIWGGSNAEGVCKLVLSYKFYNFSSLAITWNKPYHDDCSLS